MWIPPLQSLKKRFEIYQKAKSEKEKRHVELGEGISVVRDMFVANSMEEVSEEIEKVEKKGLHKKVLGGVGSAIQFTTRQTVGRLTGKDSIKEWGKGPSDAEKSEEERRQEEAKRDEINNQINTQIVKNTSMLSWLNFIHTSLMEIGTSVDLILSLIHI